MNILKTGLALIIIISASFCNVYAQGSLKKASQNYKEAIVISNSSDTLRGKIDYKQWQQNPYIISFVQAGEEEMNFTAKDIQEFRVEGDTYRTAKVDLDISPANIKKLNDTPFPTIVKDTTLFLLLLVQGEVSLYYMKDVTNKEHFFYQRVGQTAKELSYYRYYHDPVYRRFSTKESYKGQLRVISMDCEKQQLDSDIPYHTKDLVSFFVRYNSCLTGEEKVKSNSTILKGKFEVAASGGVQYTHLAFHEKMLKTTGSGLSYKGTGSNVAPLFGLALNYIMPRGLGKYSLNSTLFYAPLHMENKELVEYNGSTRLFVDEYTLNTIQLMGSFRSRFLWYNGIKFYASAGPSLIYFINPSLNKTIYKYNFRGEEVRQGSYSYEFHPLLAGVNLGVGSSWKKYSFEVRINKELSNTHSGDGYSRAINFSGLLSYTLF